MISKEGTKAEKVWREKFEVMAVRLAHHLGMSKAESFDQLPTSIRNTLNGLRYYEIVLPLVIHDREVLGLSYRQLEIKYGLPKSNIQYHVRNWRIK